MAAIGSIRKHGILLMCIIGIALLAFVMGDISQLSGLFSDKYTMVKINGKKLDEEYRARLDQNNALWRIYFDLSSLDETQNAQVHETTWLQLLEQTILENQLKNLGLSFSKEMYEEIAAGLVASLNSQQPNDLLQRMVSFIAQRSDIEQAIGFISNIEEYKNEPQVREFYNAYKAIERFAVIDAQKARYRALVQNVVNFSDEAAKFFAANNNSILAKAVTVFPTAAQFNEIQPDVTDKDVKEWFKKNSNRYEVKNDSRDIDMALFPIQPSAEDLVAIRDTVMNRTARIREATSLESYHVSMMYGQLDSIYFKRSDINIDTLVKLIFDRPVGTVIEPVEHENAVWYYGKTYGSEKRPDSVEVAFLIIDYKTDRTPNSLRTKNEAKAIADSIKNVLQRGGNIFTLIPDYLGGRNAADTTVWVAEHSIYPQLYNSFLNNDIYIHDLPSEFRVFQILQRTAPIEKRQFVIYSEEIKPSEATIKSIRSQAVQLQAESYSANDLMTLAAQKGIQVAQGKDITSMSATIAQLQNAREIVSWAYNPNTKINEISDIFNINNNSFFVVAALRDMKKKGTPQIESVRTAIETELIAMKKLEFVEKTISDELNSGSSLQQIAEKYQASLMDSVTLTFGGETYQNRGIESGAIGKIFTLPLEQPATVSGKNNVYAVSIYKMNEPGEPSLNFTMEKTALRNAAAGRGRTDNAILDGLKEKATILDQRYLYFAR